MALKFALFVLLLLCANSANAQQVIITAYTPPKYDGTGDTGASIASVTVKNNSNINLDLMVDYDYHWYDINGDSLADYQVGGDNPQPPWPLIPGQSAVCGGSDVGGTTGLANGYDSPDGWFTCVITIQVYIRTKVLQQDPQPNVTLQCKPTVTAY